MNDLVKFFKALLFALLQYVSGRENKLGSIIESRQASFIARDENCVVP